MYEYIGMCCKSAISTREKEDQEVVKCHCGTTWKRRAVTLWELGLVIPGDRKSVV